MNKRIKSIQNRVTKDINLIGAFDALRLFISQENVDKLEDHFYDINKVIFANPMHLLDIGLTEEEIARIAGIKKLITASLENKFYKSDVVSSPKATYDFLKIKIGHTEEEHFGVIFLNNQNIIIDYEILFHGTVDQAQIYPREIIKKALFKNATGIILFHNHPSGNNFYLPVNQLLLLSGSIPLPFKDFPV